MICTYRYVVIRERERERERERGKREERERERELHGILSALATLAGRLDS